MRPWTILFRPDCDRRPRIRTGSAPFPMEESPRAFPVGITAGGDFHPALRADVLLMRKAAVSSF